jgi:hypothetical protein
MRGLHGTLAVETDQRARGGGSAGARVVTTTLQSYAKAGAGALGRKKRARTCRLNEKRLPLKRFSAALRRNNPK